MALGIACTHTTTRLARSISSLVPVTGVCPCSPTSRGASSVAWSKARNDGVGQASVGWLWGRNRTSRYALIRGVRMDGCGASADANRCLCLCEDQTHWLSRAQPRLNQWHRILLVSNESQCHPPKTVLFPIAPRAWMAHLSSIRGERVLGATSGTAEALLGFTSALGICTTHVMGWYTRSAASVVFPPQSRGSRACHLKLKG